MYRVTYAVAWSSRERNEGEWMLIDGVLRKPAIRIESFRVGKVPRIPVDMRRHNECCDAFRNMEISYNSRHAMPRVKFLIFSDLMWDFVIYMYSIYSNAL